MSTVRCGLAVETASATIADKMKFMCGLGFLRRCLKYAAAAGTVHRSGKKKTAERCPAVSEWVVVASLL